MKNKIIFILILLPAIIWYDVSLAVGKQLVISSGMQYGYAQKLFNEKDYETAMVEFKRFIHFFSETDQLEQAEFSIGVCLFRLKKFHDAARALNKIIIRDKPGEITKEASFLQSRAFMKMGNDGYAQIVLENYLKLVENKDIETKDRIYFNLAKIKMEDARKFTPGALARVKENLLKISESGKIKYNTDQYFDLIYKAEHIPKKNPTLAGLFSIIPGGGFFYCERYQDALVSFLLNTGLIYAACEAWENDNKALAGVIGFVETGFYSGNIYGSISSAHKHNRNRIIKVLNKEFSITPNFDLKNNGYGLSLNFEF